MRLAGADARDGDGAGVMTGIPHSFFVRESGHCFNAKLPSEGHYAVGNLFFSKVEFEAQQESFTEIAKGLGLRVLGWRDVPTDNTILGPASKSKEPKIMQPFVVLETQYGAGEESQHGPFDEKYFLRQLYVLRKQATHKM
jgi:glutamate synthase (NADPH/NADH)